MKTCVLIQTCDNYEFLWEGLNLSWERNWDWDIFDDVYVLTEEKSFIEGRLKTLNFGMLGDAPNNFSTRMIEALNYLKKSGYDSVFYSQDDFWPLFRVDSNKFNRAISFFEYAQAACLHINEYLPWYNYRLCKTEYSIQGEPIWKFIGGSPFYYNHQAALWRIDELLKIKFENESPYENECRGTERAWEFRPPYYLFSYGWYKAEYINNKGLLLPLAQNFVRDWNWQKKIIELNDINIL